MAAFRGPEHIFEFANAAYQRLVGRTDLIGRTVTDCLPEVEGQGFFELLDTVYGSGEAHVGLGVPLTLARTPDATSERVYVDFVYQAVKSADGTVTGIFVEGYDVTDRVLAAERQKIVVAEMNHRVKNTLAIVQSLATLTGRSVKTVAEFETALSGRINAMANTQNLLLCGLDEDVKIEDVITAELRPYLRAGQDATVRCDDITIAAQPAVNLGLIIHELLTNAAKYGALAHPAGVLVVDCERCEGGARLRWREEGSQPISSKPVSSFFGMRLIEVLARDLGGPVRIEWLTNGIDVSLVVRLDGKSDLHHDRALTPGHLSRPPSSRLRRGSPPKGERGIVR